jgi:hypothetical protein
MEIEAAAGAFFAEFSTFETNGIGLVLRALCRDDGLAVQAEDLLGVEARLTLLERLAFARKIPKPLLTELTELLARARALHAHGDDLARAAAHAESDRSPARVWTPSVMQIESYVTETIELQHAFRALAGKLDTCLAPTPAAPSV